MNAVCIYRVMHGWMIWTQNKSVCDCRRRFKCIIVAGDAPRSARVRRRSPANRQRAVDCHIFQPCAGSHRWQHSGARCVLPRVHGMAHGRSHPAHKLFCPHDRWCHAMWGEIPMQPPCRACSTLARPHLHVQAMPWSMCTSTGRRTSRSWSSAQVRTSVHRVRLLACGAALQHV